MFFSMGGGGAGESIFLRVSVDTVHVYPFLWSDLEGAYKWLEGGDHELAEHRRRDVCAEQVAGFLPLIHQRALEGKRSGGEEYRGGEGLQYTISCDARCAPAIVNATCMNLVRRYEGRFLYKMK